VTVPSAARRRRAPSRTAVAVAFAVAALAGVAPLVAQPVGRAVAADAGPRWQSLSRDQREILAPLEGEWDRLDADRKRKWLAIAGRYRALPAAEQERIASRMQEWVRLSPAERGRARLTYEEVRQVPLGERQSRWEKYQSLAPEERQRFESDAARRGASAAGSRVPVPAVSADGIRPKVNTVPAQPSATGQPRSVAPTVVRAPQGATTRPVGQAAAPPAHQQAGMPKIATTPEFVNAATLLPRRGPQAAAVAAPPASAPEPRKGPQASGAEP
jgi:hypothetical protein